MSHGRTAGVVLCLCVVGAAAGDDAIRPAAGLPKSTPWDLAELSKAPSFRWIDGKAKVRSLTYQGLPYEGKPTSVFALYATPGSLAGDPNLDLFVVLARLGAFSGCQAEVVGIFRIVIRRRNARDFELLQDIRLFLPEGHREGTFAELVGIGLVAGASDLAPGDGLGF